MAIEPTEMKDLVRNCRNVCEAMGVKDRIVNNEELEQRSRMRRSIIAAKDLTAGTVLKLDDLDVKRPGTGISPDKLSALVGKVINKDIAKDYMILDSDISK